MLKIRRAGPVRRKPRPSRRPFGAPQGEIFLLKQCSRPHAEEPAQAAVLRRAQDRFSKHEAVPETKFTASPVPRAQRIRFNGVLWGWPRNAEQIRGLTAPMTIGRAHVCTPVTNAHLVCRL